MPIYSFKAVSKEGKHLGGEREAENRSALSKMIKDEGSILVEADEVVEKKIFSWKKVLNFFGKIKTHEKIIFARNLSGMIEAGLSLSRALSVMEKQARNPKLKRVLTDLGGEINKGRPLSEAMKNFPDVFSPLFYSMVKAGEESGNLASSLKIIASQMDKSYSLQRKVRGAFMYPGIIMIVMIIIGVLMFYFMVPTLTATFVSLNVDLPFSTKVIIFISNILRNNGLQILLAVLVLGLLGFYGMKTSVGKRLFDLFILKLPLVSPLIKEMNSARTARTLSSLLSSGVDFVVAIGITENVIQNSYYKDVLKKAQASIQKGDTLSSVFLEREDLYPVFVGEMASVGEETGKISEMLLGVANFYEEEVEQKTKDMSTIIEPFLMVVIGICVGIFAISMLSPMYSLADKI